MKVSTDKFYVDGGWQRSTSGDKLSVVNPATETELLTVPACSREDVEQAIAAAKRAFSSWSQTSSKVRKQYLLAIAEGMRERADELAEAISVSMGCPKSTASWLQVADPIECMTLFAEQASQTEQIEKLEKSWILKEPVGVCGLINPWNYPLHQMVSKVGAALAAGCTMIVKPSEQTPLQDYIMAEIIHDAGVPPGVFNLVPGIGAVVGRALSEHPDIDMVSFTGSTRAGIEVAKTAARSVKRVAQELGGKSPLIITESANLTEAVKYGVEDVMLNTGQTCTALTRMLVPQNCLEEAVNIAREVGNGLSVGMSEDDFLGPVSSAVHYQKVLDYIQLGQEEGARLICGGSEKPEGITQGYFIRPTVFADVKNTMRIAREEIFGPVLCIITYRDLDDAIAIANDTPYGLSSGVYAASDEEALTIARRIRAGMCFINGGVFNCEAPFGGYKQSGNGRELGSEGVSDFLELKSVTRA